MAKIQLVLPPIEFLKNCMALEKSKVIPEYGRSAGITFKAGHALLGALDLDLIPK